MRKLFISAAIAIAAGLVLGGVSTFANDTKAGQTQIKGSTQHVIQLSGKITGVKSNSFMLKDQMGKIHKIIPADPSELAKINVGDNVTVDIRDGKAVAINKTEAIEEINPKQENQQKDNNY
jgi:hypothetical protein